MNFSPYINNSSWATPSALEWLENFFAERWGGVWHITRHDLNVLALRPAEVGDLPMIFNGGIFHSGTSDLACGTWRINDPWRGAIFDVLPTPGLANPSIILFKKQTVGVSVDYNILGLIFWALTRSEEINSTSLDQFGRFCSEDSHAKKHDYLQRPLIDEWLYILAQVAEMLWPGVLRKVSNPAIALSHDVDLPARYSFANYSKLFRRIAGDILVRHEFSNALKAPFVRLSSSQRISPLDPHNQFDWMMDIAESVGTRAAFYFICGRTNADFDGDYEIEHPAMRELVCRIHERGHEVGLHPSFETYRDPLALAIEAGRLRRVCLEEEVRQDWFGGRMHYLRWKNPDTLRACVAANLKYDATLGYADAPGFRCGTCIEYQAFDPVADKSLPLRLRPLVAMEASVIEPNNLGLGTGSKAFDLFELLRRRCELVSGTFSLLWHNSSLTLSAQRLLYKRIVTGLDT